MVFASPECLLGSTGYFWNHVLRKRSGTLYSKITAFALDECHCVEAWGASGFRFQYAHLGVLRQSFPHIPFVGLTATMTPTSIKYFFKSAKFKDPVIIKQPIRRKNLNIWVAPLSTGTSYDDLRVLFPDNLSSADEIPQTIIFYNSRLGTGRMADYLRKQLPASLREKAKTIIRSYNGILDELSQKETLSALRSGECRIVVSTDAFGLGMNIKAIPRVVLWKVDSKLGIDGFYQRIGRAGRDSDQPALALVFVSKANLSGQYTKDGGNPKGKKHRNKTNDNPTETLPPEVELANAAHNEFRYTLPVCKDTKPIFEGVLPEIYAGPTKKALAENACESKLVPAINWTLQNDGCRMQPILVAFDDDEMMKTCQHPIGCDKCVMKRLIETNATESPPSLHGIPFTITMAYKAYQNSVPDKVPRKRKAPSRTIVPERIAKLVEDIKAWREDALKDLAKGLAGMTVKIIFPDDKIAAIATKAKHIWNEGDLIAALKECGYSLPESFISAYTEDLHDCIRRSLEQSQPPPQLEQQLRQAARCPRTLVSSVPVVRSNVAAPVHLKSPLFCPELPNATGTHPSFNSVPRWPIPPPTSVMPVVATRTPLAEKCASEIETNVEPKEPAHPSGYNLRRSQRNKRPVSDDENTIPVTTPRKRRNKKGAN